MRYKVTIYMRSGHDLNALTRYLEKAIMHFSDSVGNSTHPTVLNVQQLNERTPWPNIRIPNTPTLLS